MFVTAAPSAAVTPIPNPELYKPADQLTITDLEKFVDLGLSNKITVEQVRIFYAKLSEQQIQTVGRIIDARARQVARPPATSIGGRRAAPVASASSCYGCWESFITPGFAWQWQGAYAEWWYETTTACSQTGDTDYVFFFNHDSSNPSALRWASDDSSLETVLLSYNVGGGWGGLKDFGINNAEVRVCMGSRIWAAGGPWTVMLHFWVHY